VTGVGKEGDVVGAVDASDTRAPTGNTTPEPAAAPAEPAHDGPMEVSEVDVRPSLRNAEDVQRALERLYPPRLRDAGVTGETVLQLVIDENGRVEPGSIEVLNSSDEGFSDAARRVAGSMRFSPAKAGGRSVRVTTSIPVHWTIAR
jgi:protein TonB